MYTTIAIAILTGIVCFLIGKNFRSGADRDWKEQFDENQKELNNLTKQSKKDKKRIQQLDQGNNKLQQDIKDLEEKYLPIQKDLEQQLQTAQSEIKTQQTNYEKLQTENQYHINQYEQIKKEKSRLNDKYARDLKASKGWANKKEALEIDIRNLQEKLSNSRKETKALQAKIESQQERMQEVSKFAQEFRNMKAANRRLTKDLAYWEKKHYDTHHELAETMKEIEAVNTEKEELVLRLKGNKIQQDNMMKQIQEFKTKFVNVNNLYHELKKEKSLN